MSETENSKLFKTKSYLDLQNISKHRSLYLERSCENGNTTNLGWKVKKIPLIQKRMNSVQRYVDTFKTLQKAQKNSPKLSSKQNLLGSGLCSKTAHSQSIGRLQKICYLKYHSTSMEHSISKIQALEDVQKQYAKLKFNIFPQKSKFPQPKAISSVSLIFPKKSCLPHSINSSKGKFYYKKKKQEADCSNFQKQIKRHTIIDENGKKCFADLYLMKKQRSKLFQSILQTDHRELQRKNLHQSPVTSRKSSSSASKLKSANELEKKMQTQKTMNQISNTNLSKRIKSKDKITCQHQDFIKEKILKEKSLKKQKMLRAKKMNWTVYYQMLALDNYEKKKLNTYCKFSQAYGTS